MAALGHCSLEWIPGGVVSRFCNGGKRGTWHKVHKVKLHRCQP